MPRYLFEITEESSRLALYDADRQALLAEFNDGKAQEFINAIEFLQHGDPDTSCSKSKAGSCCGRGRCAANDPPPSGNRVLQRSLSLALTAPGSEGRLPTTPTLARFPVLDAWAGPLAEPINGPGLARPAPLQPLTEPPPDALTKGDTHAETCGCKSGELVTMRMKATSSRPAVQRRKLWEIDHKYHCPLIGTCLSVDELRQLGDRHAHRPSERLSDFDIHVSFVAASRERNGLSIATQKRLDKKYTSDLRRLAKVRKIPELHTYWKEALETGQVPGALWGILSHPVTDEDLSERIYQDVHMLSHQIGAGQRADTRRLNETQAEVSRLQRDFDALTRRNRAQLEARARENHDLTQALAEKTATNQRLQAQVEQLTRQCEAADAAASVQRQAGLERKLVNQNARMVRIQDERDHWRLACAEAEHHGEQARQSCNEMQALVLALEQRLASLLSDSEDTKGQDLGGRQVLCVGGRLATVEQYRALIGRSNGSFAHHDGGMEDNQNRLEAMLATADLVVCVTEFVSHDAYRRTKQFCKRHAKPHALLANAGLGSFSRALAELAQDAECKTAAYP